MGDKNKNEGKKVKSVTSVRIDTITFDDGSVDIKTSPFVDDGGVQLNCFGGTENPPPGTC